MLRVSALETPAATAAAVRRRPRSARRALALEPSPLALPIVLALGYAVVLVVRYPQIVGWQNADADVAAFYVLAGALAHGHAGVVQLATQGAWVQYGFMVATDGLSFHRVLWELFVPAMSLVTIGLCAATVSRLGGRRAAVLTTVLLIAASPTVLMTMISVGWHNTTPLGAVLLGGHLVWLGRGKRGRGRVLAGTLVVGVLVGVLLASDELLADVGLAPYVIAAFAVGLGTGDRRELLVALETSAIAVAARTALLVVTERIGIHLTTPPIALDLPDALTHARWLGEGLLRIGNGRTIVPAGGAIGVLTLGAAFVTVMALLTMSYVAGGSYRERRRGPDARRRALHTMFWVLTAGCAAVAYVTTDLASAPSDRYFVITMFAVAATVPLLPVRGGWALRGLSAGSSVFVAAGVVALATGQIHHRNVIEDTSDPAAVPALARVVAAHHLGIGYAGFWDAENLQWMSHGALRLHPLLGDDVHASAMYFQRASAWYRPRPHTATYIVLVPHDTNFPDRLPRTLPAPRRVYHLGSITIDAWPYDIAAWFHRSLIPVPGLTENRLARARRTEQAASRP